jgi:hypothetical protein
MSPHIYHATATLAELSLAMSIASMAKIIKEPAIIDNWTVVTLSQFIKNNLSHLIGQVFDLLCRLVNGARRIYSHIPELTMGLQLTVLISMGFWPDDMAHVLFGAAFFGMMIMFVFVISNRRLRDEIESEPLIEPMS